MIKKKFEDHNGGTVLIEGDSDGITLFIDALPVEAGVDEERAVAILTEDMPEFFTELFYNLTREQLSEIKKRLDIAIKKVK